MVSVAARQAAIAFLTCVALTTVLVLVGRGPWERWVAPSLLITVAAGAAAAWRSRSRAES